MRLSLFAAAALCVSSLAAGASPVDYEIYAPLSDGGLFQGTLTYDSSHPDSGMLTGAVTGSGLDGTLSNEEVTGAFSNLTGQGLSFYEQTGSDAEIDLYYPGNVFEGVLCTLSTSPTCESPSQIDPYFFATGVNFLASTTVTPIAATASVTPEPSSLALLGTGLLGLIGVARKRLL